MDIKPIRNELEYQEALKVVSPMFDTQPEMGTPEFDFMEEMILLIESYEAEHHPVEPPEPVEAIKFRMEQSGLSATD